MGNIYLQSLVLLKQLLNLNVYFKVNLNLNSIIQFLNLFLTSFQKANFIIVQTFINVYSSPFTFMRIAHDTVNNSVLSHQKMVQDFLLMDEE